MVLTSYALLGTVRLTGIYVYGTILVSVRGSFLPRYLMDYRNRQPLYQQIEQERGTKVLSFITSDRKGMETVIAQDCIEPFVDLLEKIGPTQRISLLLHTDGGNTLAAWRLVNLIRIFCDELEVLIPFKALSAGTLISIRCRPSRHDQAGGPRPN